MAVNDTDRALKGLLGLEATDSNKRLIEEFGAETINISAGEVWGSTIDSDPAQAVTDGTVALETLHVLTEDVTVPNQQGWRSSFQDWIPPNKYGSSYVLQLFDGSDSLITVATQISKGIFFDYKTGYLTADDVSGITLPFKITHHRYTGVKGIANAAVTAEALTYAVDYNDGTALEIPEGTVFTLQAQIDAFLSNGGATAFKYLTECWNATPTIVAHPVNANVAGGVHRPRSTESAAAWPLVGKVFTNNAYFSINGTGGYTPISAPLTGLSVTAEQAASGDPYVDFAGTPFLGLDLRGLMIEGSNGQINVIHDHTDSRLRLTDNIFPSLSGGTVDVVRPATVLRNSLNDTSAAYSFRTIEVSGNVGINQVYLYDTWVQRLGVGGNAPGIDVFNGCEIWCYRVLFDLVEEQALFGVAPAGRAYRFLAGSYTSLLNCGMRSSGSSATGAFIQSDFTFIGRSAFHSGARGLQVFDSVLNIRETAFTNFSTAGIELTRSEMFSQSPGSQGVYMTLSGCGVGLDFIDRATLRDVPQANYFFDTCGIGVRLGTECSVNIASGALEFQDNGGNTDVGIDLNGVRSTLILGADTDVTGTNGDVRDGDNVIVNYATISAAAPYLDGLQNLIQKP